MGLSSESALMLEENSKFTSRGDLVMLSKYMNVFGEGSRIFADNLLLWQSHSMIFYKGPWFLNIDCALEGNCDEKINNNATDTEYSDDFMKDRKIGNANVIGARKTPRLLQASESMSNSNNSIWKAWDNTVAMLRISDLYKPSIDDEEFISYADNISKMALETAGQRENMRKIKAIDNIENI
jgi:hypothetical protein